MVTKYGNSYVVDECVKSVSVHHWKCITLI